MIDLHCHILPGVDDGSPDMETSLEMLRIANRSGIRAIVATPHCSRDFPEQNLLSRQLADRFVRFNDLLTEEGIPVQVYPGMEIMVNEYFGDLLAQGRFLPLAGTAYMLIEFDFDTSPDVVEQAIGLVKRKKLIPLIAHPERYYCVQWKPKLVERWKQAGAVMQVNRGSIQGKLTEQAEICAWKLLQEGWVSVVASDAHSSHFRRPELSSVLQELAEKFSWAYAAELLIVNPARILQGATTKEPFSSIRLPE